MSRVRAAADGITLTKARGAVDEARRSEIVTPAEYTALINAVDAQMSAINAAAKRTP